MKQHPAETCLLQGNSLKKSLQCKQVEAISWQLLSLKPGKDVDLPVVNIT